MGEVLFLLLLGRKVLNGTCSLRIKNRAKLATHTHTYTCSGCGCPLPFSFFLGLQPSIIMIMLFFLSKGMLCVPRGWICLFCSVLFFLFFFVPASFFTSAFSFLTLFISFFNPHALAIHPHPIHSLNATFLHSAQLSIKQNTALALKLI